MKIKLCLFSLLAAALVTSCKEVEEESRYANWQERNEAFIDSIAGLHANTATRGDLDSIHLVSYPEGVIYFKRKASAPATNTTSPLYTDYVKVHYKGTNILGEYFDGTFKGTDPVEDGESSSQKDSSPLVTRVSTRIVGWSEVLQRMKSGDRWEVYIPWQYGYGSSGSGSILGYSTLIFDMKLLDFSRIQSDL